MQLHANAKLGPAGRVALVDLIAGGVTLKAAAAAFNVSPATAHRWWHRYVASANKATVEWARTGRVGPTASRDGSLSSKSR